MAKHKLNPAEGEVWFHPLTFNAYYIHSVTDDGWVRYHAMTVRNSVLERPLFTQPTLDFIRLYKRQENTA